MGKRTPNAAQRARLLFVLLLLFAAQSISGCVALYSRHAVTLEVIDASDGQPAGAGIRITVEHRVIGFVNKPRRINAQTDDIGRVRLRIADLKPVNVEVGNDSYVIPPKLLSQGGVLAGPVDKVQWHLRIIPESE